MPSGLIVMAEVRLEFNVYEQKENCPILGLRVEIKKVGHGRRSVDELVPGNNRRELSPNLRSAKDARMCFFGDAAAAASW